jgi:transcriptional regulator with XRE-family HTH domain
MSHPANARLTHALVSLGKDTKQIAGAVGVSEESLQLMLTGEELMPYNTLTDVCKESGINRDYVLLNRGPMTPESKKPLPTARKGKPGIEGFIQRLAAVLDAIPMTDTQIADALGTTKQSVSAWRRNGQISHDNLRGVCEIGGFDYDWVKTGDIDTQEAEDSFNRAFGSALERIDHEIARLQEERLKIAGCIGSSGH